MIGDVEFNVPSSFALRSCKRCDVDKRWAESWCVYTRRVLLVFTSQVRVYLCSLRRQPETSPPWRWSELSYLISHNADDEGGRLSCPTRQAGLFTYTAYDLMNICSSLFCLVFSWMHGCRWPHESCTSLQKEIAFRLLQESCLSTCRASIKYGGFDKNYYLLGI